MKVLPAILFFVLLLTAGNLWAQGSHTEITAPNDGYRNIITYDKKHNKTSEILQHWTANEWVNNSQIFYWKDSCLHQTWKDSAWVNNDIATYTFDGRGNKISETFRLWTPKNEWVNFTRTFFRYDSDGKVTGTTPLKWGGTDWVPQRPVVDPAPRR